jgi:hypothetical protein
MFGADEGHVKQIWMSALQSPLSEIACARAPARRSKSIAITRFNVIRFVCWIGLGAALTPTNAGLGSILGQGNANCGRGPENRHSSTPAEPVMTVRRLQVRRDFLHGALREERIRSCPATQTIDATGFNSR